MAPPVPSRGAAEAEGRAPGSAVKLYGYFRSSAAFRVRIALNLKGLDYRQDAIHLVKGEQRAPAFLALNPQGLVPLLALDGLELTQSLAIWNGPPPQGEASQHTEILMARSAAESGASRTM
jgi:hypothetical protein